jgi:hypothetical protein
MKGDRPGGVFACYLLAALSAALLAAACSSPAEDEGVVADSTTTTAPSVVAPAVDRDELRAAVLAAEPEARALLLSSNPAAGAQLIIDTFRPFYATDGTGESLGIDEATQMFPRDLVELSGNTISAASGLLASSRLYSGCGVDPDLCEVAGAIELERDELLAALDQWLTVG